MGVGAGGAFHSVPGFRTAARGPGLAKEAERVFPVTGSYPTPRYLFSSLSLTHSPAPQAPCLTHGLRAVGLHNCALSMGVNPGAGSSEFSSRCWRVTFVGLVGWVMRGHRSPPEVRGNGSVAQHRVHPKAGSGPEPSPALLTVQLDLRRTELFFCFGLVFDFIVLKLDLASYL